MGMRTTRRFGWFSAALLVCVACVGSGCARRKVTEAKRQCFDVVAQESTASTRAVFEAKRCQGGGVTWAGILGVLIKRRGVSVPIEDVTAGWTGDVRTLRWAGGVTRVAIDEEGDAARFCADSQRLVEETRSDVKRLQGDGAELARVMAEADPLALECFPEGTTLDSLMKNMPRPPEPPEER
jgi:hypothetical protein